MHRGPTTGLTPSLEAIPHCPSGHHDAVRRLLVLVAALAGLLVGVPAAVLVLRSEGDSAAPSTIVREVGRPPSTPAGSVVLARQSRELAVALAILPGRPLHLRATILGQSGKGVDGLNVELIATAGSHSASSRARNCGPGCYAATLPLAGPEQFAADITGAGAPRSVSFPLPEPWPPPSGAAFLARAAKAFRALHTVVLTERLASSPTHGIFTTWKLAAPNRVEYEIRGGPGGIVIGATRWDRPAPGAAWERSKTRVLPQPTVPWGNRVANAHVLDRTPSRVTVAWLDPEVPSWFTTTFDRRTALPIELRMTAAAHFMRHRYLAFDRKVRIEPPPRFKG
jgi:hypothetical protein